RLRLSTNTDGENAMRLAPFCLSTACLVLVLAAAPAMAQGYSGLIPAGSTASSPSSAKKSDPGYGGLTSWSSGSSSSGSYSQYSGFVPQKLDSEMTVEEKRAA